MKGKLALFISALAMVLLAACSNGASPRVVVVPPNSASASTTQTQTPAPTSSDDRSASNTASAPPNLTVKNGYPDHVPGVEDVSTMVHGQQFKATPNFHYFEKCGRPCWLPLYRTPRLIAGTTVTDNFPYERYLGNLGDALKVVCQVAAGKVLDVARQVSGGYRLQNEHRLPNSSLEASNLWDKVAVSDEAILPRHQPDITGLEPTPVGGGHYVWAADIWLATTGGHGIICK